MKDFYAQHKLKDLWCIRENGFQEDLQGIRETQFALGNGYWGARGVLEERPQGAEPGTFITGVYDRLTSQVSDLVNLPNPFFFKFILKGEKFGAAAMDIESHQRTLNMQDGLLLRRTIYRDVKNRRFDYQSLRFVSMENKNIGVMQIVLTPLDGDVEIEVQSGIDTSVFNKGGVHEGNKIHFNVQESDHEENVSYRLLETLEKRHKIIYRSGLYYKIGRKKTLADSSILRLKLKKRQSVIFTRIVNISSYAEIENIKKGKEDSRREFRKAFKVNFDSLLKSHAHAWNDLWKTADVTIGGTSDIQKNLRFNIYHMLICASNDAGLSSIGARTLSGEGYRGHIFWDAEIFLLPFYAYVFPEIAKNMLLYRHKRLDPARKIAKKQGYKGTMFPWESAETGEEETPTWAKDLDGRIIRIKTNELEHHITVDIAYACYQYALITGDNEFLKKAGYELIFSAARFWASRVSKNKQGKYEIRNVIGPDEFHEHVNNNAFTNVMAKWNLLTAHKLYTQLKIKDKKAGASLCSRMSLTEKEVALWKFIAARLVVKINKNNVIEQFDGFFRKRYIEIVNFDENGIPLLPKGVKVKDYNKTQFVKQADVLMMLYLLRDVYTDKVKESNYWFYVKRTLHKSSLSPAIHCLMALQAGSLSQAYQFFNIALRADISNLHGNTDEGIHAASLGGVWQCVVNGFAGVYYKKTHLCVDPFMPKTWGKIGCSLSWQNYILRLEVKNNEVRIRVEGKSRTKIKIEVFGRVRLIGKGKEHIFTRPKAGQQKHYYL
ncbi:MAG: glycosyl hydrolase family 65 protein [Candidatus Aceula meridiana]|nr:glycosyl hydrolase family 65 protein [Candidatus Aceula meridiana]